MADYYIAVISAERGKQKRQSFFILATFTFLTAVIFLRFATRNDPVFASQAVGAMLLCIALFFAAIFLAVGIHEIGHYLAGKAVGFRFQSMRVGPLLWSQTPRGVRFAFKPSGLKASGYAQMTPEGEHRLLQRYRWFVAGGPVSSLVLVLAAGVLLPWQEALQAGDGGLTLQAMFGRMVVLVFMAAVLLPCVNSLIPYQHGGFNNDGLKLVLSLFSRQEKEFRVLSLKWQTQIASGLPSSEWSIATLRKLHGFDTAPFDKMVNGHNLGQALLYQGHEEEGLRVLEETFAMLKPLGVLSEFEAVVAANVAFARAHFGLHAEGAQEALAKALSLSSRKGFAYHRACAAIALAAGDAVEVRLSTEAGRKWLDDHADREKPSTRAAYAEMDRLLAIALPNSI